MLKLPIISLFLRTIPEGIILVLVGYMILNKPLEKQKICITGVILGISTYFVRMLPINFGIHMILILFVYMFLLHKINIMNFYKAVTAGIVSFIFIAISEWIMLVFYIGVLGMSTEKVLDQSLSSILLGLPSLVLLFCMGMLVQKIININARKSKVH
ncbi:hypothetical protein Amet_1280 [Alkaliphilus metalliredigens QYMF]|uniref:Uncharacterized protein n=1 Tax=Alkaliphilus metalliredigens (strain QYMF) TaxID=293826 RepID=A6TMR7_ALKMQ|nr:hypothetical protein [Alkaliphilus metalliredigens]ABR47485.1 hypothetical protein Amet_1280 [Alkaliphilus metalliredigens QYMF]